MRDRGFEPCVAAPENLRSLVERAGVQHAPLHGNSQAILGSGDGQRTLRPGNVFDLMKAVAEVSREIDPRLFATGPAAVQGADAIVGGTRVKDLAFTLACVPIIVPRAGPEPPSRPPTSACRPSPRLARATPALNAPARRASQ